MWASKIKCMTVVGLGDEKTGGRGGWLLWLGRGPEWRWGGDAAASQQDPCFQSVSNQLPQHSESLQATFIANQLGQRVCVDVHMPACVSLHSCVFLFFYREGLHENNKKMNRSPLCTCGESHTFCISEIYTILDLRDGSLRCPVPVGKCNQMTRELPFACQIFTVKENIA